MKRGAVQSNKKTIYLFIFLVIVLIGFIVFNNLNEDYILITGDTATTPCTNLGGKGCTKALDAGEIPIDDGNFCSGYSNDFYRYCIACNEGYVWVRENNDIIKGSCQRVNVV